MKKQELMDNIEKMNEASKIIKQKNEIKRNIAIMLEEEKLHEAQAEALQLTNRVLDSITSELINKKKFIEIMNCVIKHQLTVKKNLETKNYVGFTTPIILSRLWHKTEKFGGIKENGIKH